jgi:hypothetical protein
VANAGSVGLPYEGRPGAFWMIVTHGCPELRETKYDLSAAVNELCASGFPDLEEAIREALLAPIDPAWVTTFFEHQAGRGEHPGAPRPASHQRQPQEARSSRSPTSRPCEDMSVD